MRCSSITGCGQLGAACSADKCCPAAATAVAVDRRLPLEATATIVFKNFGLLLGGRQWGAQAPQLESGPIAPGIMKKPGTDPALQRGRPWIDTVAMVVVLILAVIIFFWRS